VAAPSRNAAKPPKYGADGVVPQQNPANRSFGTTPPARPFPEFDGLAGTPPNLGGEFQTLNCQFIHTCNESDAVSLLDPVGGYFHLSL